MTKRGFSTRTIHLETVTPTIKSTSISPPIYQTASFSFDHMDELAPALHHPEHAYSYSRLSNPTVDLLEHALADLEATDCALGFASGMAAIHAAVVGLCKSGDHIVAPASLYGGTFSLFRDILPRFGIETTFVENGNITAARDAMRPATKIVYAETVGNPALFVADLPELARLAHSRGAKLVVDSTFATPYLCRPAEHGADLVVHSASKYLGGHGDLIAGIVAGSEALVAEVRKARVDTGGVMAPITAWLILRGLKTLAVRMDRHTSSAKTIAEYLEQHPKVARVIHPGLPSHPQHATAMRLLGGRCGMVAFEVRGTRETTTAVLDALDLICRAGSLGDTSSLIIQPAATTHRQMTAAELTAAQISEAFVRMSVGLEDVEDLIADLDAALAEA